MNRIDGIRRLLKGVEFGRLESDEVGHDAA
jgi:hypothetical protein